MSRILLTGGGGAGTQALWELWGTRHELFFADADVDALPPSVPAERRVKVPFAVDAAFLPELQRSCAQHRIDIVVPGVDEELISLARVHGADGWPRILLPSASFVELMLDKLESMRAIAAAGLSVPQTAALSDVATLDQLTYPLIVKPRRGRGSRGVMVIERPAQLDAYLALHSLDPDHVVVQQRLAGAEFTVFACDSGERGLQVVPVRVIQKRGITIRARTEANERIIRYVRQFHEAFRPTGPYNVQCMLDEDGSVRPFEVNPRVSTTLCLAVAAGADPFGLPGRANSVWSPNEQWSLGRTWLNQLSPWPAQSAGPRNSTEDSHA